MLKGLPLRSVRSMQSVTWQDSVGLARCHKCPNLWRHLFFDITIQPSFDTSIADDAAKSTTIWLIRQGFTKHAMNMGQRTVSCNQTIPSLFKF
ncbi:hypothetical protein F5888DRAFT_1680555 [Russula emetica]|nr:hypothetical protein F5888DRAFT_1680555 [Russula emetica]